MSELSRRARFRPRDHSTRIVESPYLRGPREDEKRDEGSVFPPHAKSRAAGLVMLDCAANNTSRDFRPAAGAAVAFFSAADLSKRQGNSDESHRYRCRAVGAADGRQRV